MGQVVKPNLALPTELIIILASRLTQACLNAVDKKKKFEIIVFGTYIVVSYILSLRGSEGLMLDLTVVNRELKQERDYCILGLKGKVKGESVHRDHLFPCILKTSSSIDANNWVKMLSAAHSMAGRGGRPAITDWNGLILAIGLLDTTLHEYLAQMFEDGIAFPQEIKTSEDIFERFSVFRSLRRASTTRAINQNVSSTDIDVINRWKSVEVGKGKKPNRPMRQHYTEISELTQPFLRYTSAM